MYVYKFDADSDRFAVGYFDPTGAFKVASRHVTREAAQARVNYLNGGTGNPPPAQ